MNQENNPTTCFTVIRIRAFLWCTFLVFSLLSIELCGASIDSVSVDSLSALRKKFSSEPLLDKLISFPGRMLYFPIGLVFSGVEQSLIVVENYHYDRWAFQYITPKESRKGITPAFSKREGVGFDYYYKGLLSPGTRFSFAMKIGLNWRQKWALSLQKIPLGHSGLFSDVSLLYQVITFDSFYGIGPDAPKSARTGFSHEKAVVNLAVGFMLSARSTVKLTVGADHNNILKGSSDTYPSITEKYSSDTLPGLGTGLRFLHMGGEFDFDSRNHRGLTTSGWTLHVNGQRCDQIGQNVFSFWLAEMDIRHHIHLFYERTLMLRCAAEIRRHMPGCRVPFFYLSELGRSETIRGFNQGRFRDNDMMLLSVEYRYPFWRTISSIIFLDAGQVSNDIFSQYRADHFAYGYGFGFRIQSRNRLFLKTDIALSQDGIRLYVNVND
jgi:hypothetical protein